MNMILLDASEFAYVGLIFLAVIFVVILVSMLIFGVFFINKLESQSKKFQELFTSFNTEIGDVKTAVVLFTEKFDNLNKNAYEIRVDIEKYVAEYKEGLRNMEANYRTSATYYYDLEKKISELKALHEKNVEKMMSYIRQFDTRIVTISYHVPSVGHYSKIVPEMIEFLPNK